MCVVDFLNYLLSAMGKHPDLMVAHPTSTIFTTIGRNYEISFFFRKKFRKGVHQNIDQKADIWSEPSQGRKFWRKKNISTMTFLDVEM